MAVPGGARDSRLSCSSRSTSTLLFYAPQGFYSTFKGIWEKKTQKQLFFFSRKNAYAVGFQPNLDRFSCMLKKKGGQAGSMINEVQKIVVKPISITIPDIILQHRPVYIIILTIL